MRNWVSGVVLVLAFIFAASAVSALNPVYLLISDCGLGGVVNATCGDTVVASCNISVVAPQISQTDAKITSVTFWLNGNQYSPTRVAGNTTNGRYSVNYVVTSADTGPVVFQRVQATTAYASCETNDGLLTIKSPETGYCALDAPDISPSVANLCRCVPTKTESKCGTNNRKSITYSYVPAAACGGKASVVVSDVWCDYCDPGWVSYNSGACEGIFTDPSNFFYGTSHKEYVKANSACCLSTNSTIGSTDFNHNTGSDCIPPIDNGAPIICSALPWLRQQATVTASGDAQRLTSFDTSGAVQKSYSGSSDYQPLIYGVNGDGTQEVFIFSGNNVSVLTKDLVLQQTMDLGASISGQPAFWGIDDTGSSFTFQSSISVNGTPRLLVPTSDNVVHVLGFNPLNGYMSELTSASMGAYAPGGIGCFRGYCYFSGWKTGPNDLRLFKINPLTAAWTWAQGDYGIGGTSLQYYDRYFGNFQSPSWPPSFSAEVAIGSSDPGSIVWVQARRYNSTVYAPSLYWTDLSLVELQRFDVPVLVYPTSQSNLFIPGAAVVLGKKVFFSYYEDWEYVLDRTVEYRTAQVAMVDSNPYGSTLLNHLNYWNDPGLVRGMTPKTKVVWQGAVLDQAQEGLSNVALSPEGEPVVVVYAMSTPN